MVIHVPAFRHVQISDHASYLGFDRRSGSQVD